MEIQVDVDALLEGRFVPVSNRGYSQHVKWQCEDNYIVGYSTGKITKSYKGQNDGKFACIVWKPNNKKKPTSWSIVYFRTFSQRKLAKKYAEKHYYKHSPKRAIKHGVA